MTYAIGRLSLFWTLVLSLILSVASLTLAQTREFKHQRKLNSTATPFNKTNNAPSRQLDLRQFATISSNSKNDPIQPFHATKLAPGNIVTVPEGKILVIELVTGVVFTNADQADPLQLRISNPFHNVFIAPSFSRPSGTVTFTSYTHSVRFYVSPGQSLELLLFGSSVLIEVNVHGQYIDVP